jgi:dynein heavy chain
MNILVRFDKLTNALNDKQKILFLKWIETVPNIVKIGLNRSILKRDQFFILVLNFDPELFAVLKEVSYLRKMSYENIPAEALEVRIIYISV